MSQGAPDGDDVDIDIPGTVTTVTELNTDISQVIKRSDDLEFDYIIGDVSDDSVSNGTRYFQLVDDNAGLQCLAFSSVRSRLPEFDEGDRVAVKGKLNYFEKRGNCSIYVDDVIGIGDSHYHQQIEKIRAALEEEGLFDDERKQALPHIPTRVGIITAADSDAEEDAINGIHSRHPDINIYLCDARVQGDNAVEDLCNAIAYFDSFAPVDVIVLTRGGGSEQDLHAFNTEGVSRMVASSTTPVVTAIGHENDTPIVDSISDARAMTPTEIGAAVTPEKSQLVKQNNDLSSRLSTAYTQTVHTTITNYLTKLDTAYEQHAAADITELQNDVTAAYTQYRNAELTRLRNDVDSAYEQHVIERVTSLRTDVDAAHASLQQQKQHEEETEELRSRETMYKAALVVLALLFLGVLFAWIFL